ncbi:MAG: hypothetical protein AAGG69_09810 [Pseudomonadota bacterium]
MGTVSEARTLEDGSLWSISWDQRFDAVSDRVFPIVEGEIGVQLPFNEYEAYFIVDAPAVEDGNQVLEIPITGKSRVILEAEGLNDDSLVAFARSGGGQGWQEGTTGWRNTKGANYLDPGEWELSLRNEDTGESHQQMVTLAEGETQTVTFTFTQTGG